MGSPLTEMEARPELRNVLQVRPIVDIVKRLAMEGL